MRGPRGVWVFTVLLSVETVDSLTVLLLAALDPDRWRRLVFVRSARRLVFLALPLVEWVKWHAGAIWVYLVPLSFCVLPKARTLNVAFFILHPF